MVYMITSSYSYKKIITVQAVKMNRWLTGDTSLLLYPYTVSLMRYRVRKNKVCLSTKAIRDSYVLRQKISTNRISLLTQSRSRRFKSIGA